MAERAEENSSDDLRGEGEEGEEEEEVVEEKEEAPPFHKPLHRYDSLDVEAAKLSASRSHGTSKGDIGTIMLLAFQSLGVVYGDIGTSPLYVFASTFTDGIRHKEDILGVLSLIYYTITLIPLVKYVLIVLRANDNGDGGTFALYSLICRHTKVGLLPSQQAEDRDVSNFRLDLPKKLSRSKRALQCKSALEKSPFAKYFLLVATMLGTAMVIGDGILTPCVSVLSAVGGLKEATSAMTDDRISWISIAVLIILFLSQRFGTDKVGYSFAPIITLWLASIAGIGVFNFFKYDPWVFRAINPMYTVN